MKPQQPYNIVFIVADQWRGDCLGLAESRHPVMTPHVDQLAAEGIRFRQAYADCPVCMPQRATMLTGRVASRFGLPRNFGPGTRTPIDLAASLPARLTREAGYQTKAIGKMHFRPDRARYGFEHITLHPNDYVNWLEDEGYGGLWRGHGLGGNEVYPAVSAVPESHSHTHWIVDQSIEFLYQRDPDTPFFLWMVFEAPHSPFDPPEPFDRMYDHFPIPEPIFGDWCDSEQYPPVFKHNRTIGKFDQLNEHVIQEARRRYYGQISHVDYQLARFFGELKTRGLYDDTVIIFTSDHGEHLGDHGLFAKQSFLAGSGNVPLIIRFPPDFPLLRPAWASDYPVLTADICPTLLEMAGLQPGSDLDGFSLIPYLQSGEGLTNRIICGESDFSAFAADGRYKYIYYPEGGIEHLFDLVNDPDDRSNLAPSPEHQSVLKPLKAAMIDHLSRFERPMVDRGTLGRYETQIDEATLRAVNNNAWRGPMRYGRGYG